MRLSHFNVIMAKMVFFIFVQTTGTERYHAKNNFPTLYTMNIALLCYITKRLPQLCCI